MPAALENHLHAMIQANGPISFDRFMEEALYHPQWGYYESDTTEIGHRGDFQTSVSVGSFFGELLARQFWDWAKEEASIQWLECGAHHGQLAEDMLNSLQALTALETKEVQYLIFETSDKRRNIQQKRLKRFGESVHWVSSWQEVKNHFRRGVIFSNELLDAFPTKKFVWNRKSEIWMESFVGSRGNQFEWVQQTTDQSVPAACLSDEEFAQLKPVLPDQYTIERSISAENWWKEAAQCLDCGHLVTFDYGFISALEKFAAQRTRGTLRTYSRHRLGDELLMHPGQKDITAHVDFHALKNIGETTGLKNEGLISQESMMHRCFELALKQDLKPSPKQLAQFRTLMHPEHFGKSFKVLIQSKRD